MRISDWSSDVCSSDLAPPLPAIVERLCRAIFSRRIPPPQPITIDEDDTAQNAPVINPRTAMALRKIGLKTRHLLVRQPIQLTHHSGSSLRSEEHTSELQSLMRTSYAVFCLTKHNSPQ